MSVLSEYNFDNYREIKNAYSQCAVKGCSSFQSVKNDVVYHKMPVPNKDLVVVKDYFDNKKQMDHLPAWKHVLKIKSISSNTRVCSLHFKNDDYFILPGT